MPGAGAGARVSASTRARDWMCCCRVSRLLLTRLLLVLLLVSPQRLYRGRLQLVTSSSTVTSVMLMAHFFSYTSSHLFSCTGISHVMNRIYTLSKQYLYTIYTLSIQYLRSIYTLSTQYLRTVTGVYSVT